MAGKIRIAEVVPEMLPMPPVMGGAVEQLVHGLTINLARNNKNLDITVFSRPPQNINHSLLKIKSRVSYEYIPFTKSDMFFMYLKSKVSWKNPLRVIAKLQNVHFYSLKAAKKTAGKFDIIHVHNDPNIVPYLRKKSPLSKIVLHMHNNHLAEGGLLKKRYEKIVSDVDKVVFVSNYIMTAAARCHPKQMHKFEVVHNGIDTDVFKRTIVKGKNSIRNRLGIGSSKMILYVGRLVPEKGVHVLLSALEKVKSKFPDTKLVICGSSWYGKDTGSAYVKELRKLASPHKESIMFTGYIAHDSMPEIFSTADVFVCPSSWEEPFGLVCVEAMSCEVPVVVTNSGGLTEILPANYKFVSSKENSSDLAMKIIDALVVRKRSAFGKRLRNHVEKNFSIRVFSNGVAKVFEKLVA